MYTVKKGIAPESDVAVVSILGYDPFKFDVSRGVFEAVGSHMPFHDGDLALRCNFATLGSENKIIDRRVGRTLTTKEANELSEAINNYVRLESYPVNFQFKNSYSHRCALGGVFLSNPPVVFLAVPLHGYLCHQWRDRCNPLHLRGDL